jgi:hypothetical protein
MGSLVCIPEYSGKGTGTYRQARGRGISATAAKEKRIRYRLQKMCHNSPQRHNPK